jgi:hypothetical protein
MPSVFRRTGLGCQLTVVVLVVGSASAAAGQRQAPLARTSFASAFDSTPDRPWPGPDYWTNPLQDWRVQGGRLECINDGPNRSAHLLTFDLGARPGVARLEVKIAAFRPGSGDGGDAWTGFRVAARGRFDDYRDSAVYGRGIDAGLRGDGRLFVADTTAAGAVPRDRVNALRAVLDRSTGAYRLTLSAIDEAQREIGRVVSQPLDDAGLHGNLALVCHQATCAFSAWHASGAKIDAHPERAFGPILFAEYTLSGRVLKLTAQMAPVGTSEPQDVRLSAAGRDVSARIDPLARTATFRIADWNDTRDEPYRIVYRANGATGRPNTWSFDGVIRRDPRDKPAIVVAAFTGNNDLGFPHADVVGHVSTFEPDLLAFTGDQIYESVGGFRIQREPLEAATLDYLRKWFMFGWEYRDLLRRIPSVMLPDDHDVYQGNLWGAGGRDANDGPQDLKIDNGGYVMPAAWVNAVQRTQTSHLPDPVDPAPVERGIGVYFTEFVWGGVSFAILEDRKWKSAPAIVLPAAKIVNGWAQNPDFDSAKSGDVAGAELLGPRQMRFLERWADDWPAGTWMKAVISQTLFADVATLPAGSHSDDVTTKLPILPPGDYARGEAIVQDHDSDGWPQTPRNAALRVMRRAKALHIAGDQHLGSTIQYGIDEFRDGPYAICVPSVSNYFPRRWFPPNAGGNPQPGLPRNTGDYLDGFGNRMTVLAVSNPHTSNIEPRDINSRAPGYGIITFDRRSLQITLANWPRSVDPSAPGAKPYPGWPITIHRDDNAGRRD